MGLMASNNGGKQSGNTIDNWCNDYDDVSRLKFQCLNSSPMLLFKTSYIRYHSLYDTDDNLHISSFVSSLCCSDRSQSCKSTMRCKWIPPRSLSSGSDYDSVCFQTD